MILQAAILLSILFGVLIPFGTWRTCVYAALVALVAEGALRKWFFPSAGELLFFLKDLILIIGYAKYLRRRNRSSLPPYVYTRLKTSIAIAVTYIGVAICNFNLGSPIIGLIGFKNYLMYLPLLFMVQELFNDEKEIIRFFNFYLLILIPTFAVALLQYRSSPESRWNQYAQFDSNSAPGSGIATAGGKVRATSFFPYISGYTGYLCANLVFLIPLLIKRNLTIYKAYYLTLLLFVLAGMLMTGSRGTLVFGILFILLFCVTNPTARTDKGLATLIGSTLVIGFISLTLFPDQWNSFSARFEKAQNVELHGRIAEAGLFGVVNYIGASGFFGYGPGATYQAVGTIRGRLDLPPGTTIPFGFEDEQGRVMAELGLIGFSIWTVVKILLIGLTWRAALLVHSSFLRDIGICSMAYQILGMFTPTIFTSSNGLFLWFFAGFLFLIVKLDSQRPATVKSEDLSSYY